MLLGILLEILVIALGTSLALGFKKNEVKEYVREREVEKLKIKARKHLEKINSDFNFIHNLSQRKKVKVNTFNKKYLETNIYKLNPKYAEIITSEITGDELEDSNVELTTYKGTTLGAITVEKDGIYELDDKYYLVLTIQIILSVLWIVQITKLGFSVNFLLALICFIISVCTVKLIYILIGSFFKCLFGKYKDKEITDSIIDTIGIVKDGQRLGDLIINANELQLPIEEDSEKRKYIQVSFKRYILEDLKEEHLLSKHIGEGEPFVSNDKEELYNFIVIHEDYMYKAKDIIINKLKDRIESMETHVSLTKEKLEEEIKNECSKYL